MRHAIQLVVAGAMILNAVTACTDSGTNTGGPLLKLLANDGAPRDFFGGSVAISGTTAIVGATGDGDGSAYLFTTTTGRQIAKLLPNDEAVRDGFGFSVAISGTTAIVGALAGGNEDGPGAAYLFDTATGQQLAKLTAVAPAALEQFGWSVAIGGITAVVGNPTDGSNAFISGSVAVFDISDPASPKHVAKIIPNDSAFADGFGVSVAINGTTVIIGALGGVNGVSSSSGVYLFDISDPANPVQIAKLLPNDFVEDSFFGFSVAISGTTAIVGANNDDDNGEDSGSAYLFDAITGQQIAKLLPDDDARAALFGLSVVISGTTAIVGAPQGENGNGLFSGSAYVFDTTRR